MKTLLEQRHPDIPTYIVRTTKKYINKDVEGNITEALHRNSLDEDFTDVTEREIERQKLEREIAKQEKEIERQQRKAHTGIFLLIYDSACGVWVDEDRNIFTTLKDEEGNTLWYRPGHPSTYTLVEELDKDSVMVRP